MPVRVGMPDDGSAVTVARGDTLELALPQNASTGYRWEVSPTAGLEVVGDRLEPPRSDRAGAGGQRVFVVRVDEPGTVRARLRRSWESPDAAVWTYAVRVRTS